MITTRTITVLLLAMPSVAVAASKNSPQPIKPTPVTVRGSWAGIKLMNQMREVSKRHHPETMK